MSSPSAGGGGEMFRLPGQQCGIALLTAPTNQIIEQRLWPALWSPPPVTGQTSTTLTCQSSQTETVLNYTVTPNKLACEGQVSQGKTSNSNRLVPGTGCSVVMWRQRRGVTRLQSSLPAPASRATSRTPPHRGITNDSKQCSKVCLYSSYINSIVGIHPS